MGECSSNKMLNSFCAYKDINRAETISIYVIQAL